MDPSERIPHDDWVDQDLLTKGEAAERLEAEIVEVSGAIDAGDDSEMSRRRLAAMREALAHMRGDL